MLLAMRRDPALWLLVAILAAHGAIIFTHFRHPLITDEVYYVAKARYLAEHHRFAPIDPHALAAERGLEWGNSDWRPPGYPLLVAAISLGDFSDPAGALRFRVTLAQFLMVAAAMIALYRAAVQAGAPRYAAAILLGVPPWIFAVVNEIGPDPENLALVAFGLLALGKNRIALGTFLLSLTLFFRPEMIMLPPIIVAIAIVLGPPAPGEGRCLQDGAPHPPLRGTFSPHAGRRTTDAAVAAAIYLLLVGAQVAYRTSFTGKLGVFGGLHIYNRGAFDWANSWLGTEKESYDFVYALGEGLPARVPERAFDSAAERAAVEQIVARVVERRRYTAEDDAAFEALARAKQRDHPIRVVLLRGWHTIHLWLNVETNNPLLGAMSSVPRPVRLPIWGALLLLRIAALVLAAASLRGNVDRLVILMMSYAIARSLLVGMVLNWNVHRYVLSAWPPVLFCACVALRPRR
jgi:hypothetical protein